MTPSRASDSSPPSTLCWTCERKGGGCTCLRPEAQRQARAGTMIKRSALKHAVACPTFQQRSPQDADSTRTQAGVFTHLDVGICQGSR